MRSCVLTNFNDFGYLRPVVKCTHTNDSLIIMSKTVNCFTLTQQQVNLSLNDQTNIQGPLVWVKSTRIDRNTRCQIKQLRTQGT